MTVREEAVHSERVRAFLEQHNRRLGRLEAGQRWVRVRPPTMEEAAQLATDRRCIKFARAGTLVHVKSIDPEMDGAIQAEASGDVLCFARREFLGTFMRTVDWAAPGSSPLRSRLTY